MSHDITTAHAPKTELFASPAADEFTLANLRKHMRDFGQVNEDLLKQLRDRAGEVIGTPPETRVRFRSSSNAEDAVEFNGAGLYDSTSGCVADALDAGTSGPSICDETKGGERALSRALRRVWSSQTRDGVVIDRTLVLDEAYLIDELSLQTQFEHRGETVTTFYGSCDLELLQLWEIRAELEDGTNLRLDERFRLEVFGDFQPAALVGATVDIAGQRRTVSGYWDLVYSSTRHNSHREHMVILDPPVAVPGLEKPVFAVQLVEPDDHVAGEAVYRDENLEEIGKVGIASYERTESFDVADSVSALRVAITSIDKGGDGKLPH